LPAYRLPSLYERQPLSRRASGVVLAIAVNLLVLLLLLTIDHFAPPPPNGVRRTIVDLISESQANEQQAKAVTKSIKAHQEARTVPKPPPIILPSKPTIVTPPRPREKSPVLVEMSADELAAADIGNLPKNSGSDGDSEAVGRAPNGDVLYAAEWARHPTDAELGGYLPANAPDGYGLVACKTIPDDRVDDCVELDQEPHGSHLASAVRQAAWQFRVRPPRKNGRPLIGAWVRIRIDYERVDRSASSNYDLGATHL
jgi:protein TonB